MREHFHLGKSISENLQEVCFWGSDFLAETGYSFQDQKWGFQRGFDALKKSTFATGKGKGKGRGGVEQQIMGVSLNGGTPKTPQNDHF